MKRLYLRFGGGLFRGVRVLLCLAPMVVAGALRDLGDSSLAPIGALGYPSRAPDLDVSAGFRNPPPGYGEVPFWWWTGDPLDRERLLWQIEELHRKGIAGVQVNYAHEDTPGWPTYAAQPEIFSDEWWDFWKFVADECGKRDMGIGLSGYTLDWPNERSLVSRTIYADPDIGGRELQVASRTKARVGDVTVIDLPSDVIGVRAYPVRGGFLEGRGRALTVPEGERRVEWRAPDGDWEVWVFRSVRKPGALNPVHPMAGRRVIEKFFQRFEDHANNRSSKGLNYFFHDELQFGVGDHVWTEDFAEQFLGRKGYDVFEALPALFAEMGAKTVKARLDYMDVRMQLVQERYFMPIFEWHASRGLIYGCDQGSRGLDPMEFGDYFSAVRWYTAPGHDTPGGQADLIKGKVSSSIAHLYRRPRVWLEGYHSLGWGAAPERLMQATCENYLYGCNLLNLHGLYYSTHGSFWEWAPPCYHFRMPYWDHMGVFLKYFERLSYVLSQGVHQSDIAVLYPVTPGQAGLDGKTAAAVAFETGTRLFKTGRDFIFIDDDSVAGARIEGGRLHVADASYAALILPAMRAIRWPTLRQALALQQGGGTVVGLGALPEASDRAGSDDPELDGLVRELFGATAAEAKAGRRPSPQRHASGGLGAALLGGEDRWSALAEVLRPIPLAMVAPPAVKAVHRRIGPRDVYFVTGAAKGTEATFRARGRVELWDPWTGETRPIHEASVVEGGTKVRLPLEGSEAQLIVFTPGDVPARVMATDLAGVTAVETREGRVVVTGYADRAGPKTATAEVQGSRVELRGIASEPVSMNLGGDWEFELKPTLDNRWGDFRLPITETTIGPEARLFRYAEETAPEPGWHLAELDDSGWAKVTGGFGPRFWKLGPLPAEEDVTALEARLAATRRLDATQPMVIGGRRYAWSAYDISWRWGKEGDPGHQGWHGLKENVSDDFLCLGEPTAGHNETLYREEAGGTRYYLWTSAVTERSGRVRAHLGGLRPAALYVNGKPVPVADEEWELKGGSNPLLVRYDGPGRGHLVLQDEAVLPRVPAGRTPLAMRWHDLPGVVGFDVRPGEVTRAGWYRFTAPPGLRGFTMTVTGRGIPQVWVDGTPCRVSGPPLRRGDADPFRVQVEASPERASQVAIRIVPKRGGYGGAALPEAIVLDCGPGRRALGDWSEGSVLENYSGGAWYRREVRLDRSWTTGRVRLDLGRVIATAEVRVNGRTAGVRVAPPWVVDVSGLVQEGTNQLSILVYNTLANHYLTVPTRYRGHLESGLIGPVRLEFEPQTALTESR